MTSNWAYCSALLVNLLTSMFCYFFHTFSFNRSCLVGPQLEIKICTLGTVINRIAYPADYCHLEGAGRQSQPMPIRWMAWESVLMVGSGRITLCPGKTILLPYYSFAYCYFCFSLYTPSTGQVHLQVGRLVVRRNAVGNFDLRPGATVRESERRQGDREHRSHVPGQQETRKWCNKLIR